MRRRTLIAVLAGLALALLVPAADAAEAVTVVRVFHVRAGADALMRAGNAIQPMLSEQGSLTVQPHQGRLTVQDRPEVVARVERLVTELTRSPRRYQIRVELLEATNADVATTLQADVDEKVKRMFRFKSFRRLGATVFDGEMGEPASANLGPSHLVTFVPRSPSTAEDTPWAIRAPNPNPSVSLEEVRLLRVDGTANGVEKRTEVLRTNIMLAPRQRAVLGASASEGSQTALVLILEALLLGER